MQTYTAAGEQEVKPGDNVVSLLAERAASHPDSIALAYRRGDEFVPITAAEMLSSVKALAAGLLALGLQKGDRVSLFSQTRYEFTLLEYAVWAAGAAAVTIYETSSADQVEWIVGNSGSTVLICETPEMKALYDQVADRLPSCRHALVIDEGALAQLADSGTALLAAEVDQRIAEISHNDLAALVYTSGTTGRPKGCALTHGNVAFVLAQLEVRVPALFRPGERTLLFLTLAHIAGQVIQVGCVSLGIEIYFASGIDKLREELAMVKPTWMFAVPRVFEKIYNGASQTAHADGKGAIFDRAADVAVAYSRGLDSGKVGLGTRVQHALFDRLVYSKLRDIFGGELRFAISGAAPLGERLGHFFRGIGLTPMEAYGLTETTGVSNINGTDAQRMGSVGRPIAGVSIGIADDGEIMIKGGCIMTGYWMNDAATKEAIDPEGWFHSGDVGHFDEDGYLFITGRKKELIITAGGKNVAPAVLEDRVRGHTIISQCLVIGEGQPFIAALVTIDEETLPVWAEEHEKPDSALQQLIDDPELKEAVQEAIDDANGAVSKAESIRTFRILPEDLSVEGGQLTPSLKVKRDVVLAENQTLIDEIYAS